VSSRYGMTTAMEHIPPPPTTHSLQKLSAAAAATFAHEDDYGHSKTLSTTATASSAADKDTTKLSGDTTLGSSALGTISDHFTGAGGGEVQDLSSSFPPWASGLGSSLTTPAATTTSMGITELGRSSISGLESLASSSLLHPFPSSSLQSTTASATATVGTTGSSPLTALFAPPGDARSFTPTSVSHAAVGAGVGTIGTIGTIGTPTQTVGPGARSLSHPIPIPPPPLPPLPPSSPPLKAAMPLAPGLAPPENLEKLLARVGSQVQTTVPTATLPAPAGSVGGGMSGTAALLGRASPFASPMAGISPLTLPRPGLVVTSSGMSSMSGTGTGNGSSLMTGTSSAFSSAATTPTTAAATAARRQSSTGTGERSFDPFMSAFGGSGLQAPAAEKFGATFPKIPSAPAPSSLMGDLTGLGLGSGSAPLFGTSRRGLDTESSSSSSLFQDVEVFQTPSSRLSAGDTNNAMGCDMTSSLEYSGRRALGRKGAEGPRYSVEARGFESSGLRLQQQQQQQQQLRGQESGRGYGQYLGTGTGGSSMLALQGRYTEPSSRAVLRWPHLSFRFMFLGDPLKRQLSDLVARCRAVGVTIQSPYRDKTDQAACLMIEGPQESVGVTAKAISGFLVSILSRMCSVKVMLSAAQRERLTASELTR
jgi:hypothetical protein